MRWFERMLSAAMIAVGLAAVTPQEVLLVYFHLDPLRFLHELRLPSWELELIGLALIVGGLVLLWHSLRASYAKR